MISQTAIRVGKKYSAHANWLSNECGRKTGAMTLHFLEWFNRWQYGLAWFECYFFVYALLLLGSFFSLFKNA